MGLTLPDAAAPSPSSIAALAGDLTVIIPAYNEQASIGDTIRSLQAQTVGVKAVIVVGRCGARSSCGAPCSSTRKDTDLTMMAGLPGTGVGGLFYLLAALLLPVRYAWLRARGRSDRSHVMLLIRQMAMSVSMIAAVWLTGALLGLWKPLPTMVTGVPIVLPIVLMFGTLVVILVVVEIGRLLIRPPDLTAVRGTRQRDRGARGTAPAARSPAATRAGGVRREPEKSPAPRG